MLVTTWFGFLFYFHMVVEYSFSGDALCAGYTMSAAEKLAQHAPGLMFRSNNDRQHAAIVNDREISYLRRGLNQPGGKLPLFDLDGQEFEASVIRRCIESGWAEPWFSNPLKPEWLVCKLTPSGRETVERALDLQMSTIPNRRITLVD